MYRLEVTFENVVECNSVNKKIFVLFISDMLILPEIFVDLSKVSLIWADLAH